MSNSRKLRECLCNLTANGAEFIWVYCEELFVCLFVVALIARACARIKFDTMRARSKSQVTWCGGARFELIERPDTHAATAV